MREPGAWRRPPERLARLHASAAATWTRLPGNVRGSLWLMASALVLSVMVTFIKLAGSTLPVVEILFFRQIMVAVVVSPAIARDFPAVFRTRHLKHHLLRVTLSAGAMLTGFTAVVHMPLAEVTAIGFARTLFATLLAVVLLKELVGWRRWTATAVGFIGVLVIVRPTPEGLNEYAVLALVSALLVAVVMILLRILSQADRAATIMAYQSLILAVLFAVPTAWFWVTPTLTDLVLVAIAGLLMSVGQWAMINAYRAGEAAAIAPMEYFRLLFASLLGFWIFAEIPTVYTLVGSLIVVASTLYTIHRNAVVKRSGDQA